MIDFPQRGAPYGSAGGSGDQASGGPESGLGDGSAAVERYEQAMERLREEQPPAPSELVDDILAYVFSVNEEDLPTHKLRIRWFLIGGGVTALVVLAIVGAILVRRGRFPALVPVRTDSGLGGALPLERLRQVLSGSTRD